MGIDGSALSRVAYLDRDGVINAAFVKEGRPYPPRSVEETQILPGVRQALALLREAGFRFAIITNQPDVSRGTQKREVVDAINAFLVAELSIDLVEVCYHDEDDGCDCRKPKPGLIYRAAATLNSDPAAGVVVGDRWRDIDAGRAVGCRTVWIDRGYSERAPRGFDFRAESLLDAVGWIRLHCI